MKVLVTGGTGFIGARVTLNLLNRGVPVVVADSVLNMPWIGQLAEFYDAQHSDASVAENLKDAEFVEFDVADPTSVDALFSSHPGITHVIHLAFMFNNDILSDIRRGASVNIVGTANLLEASVNQGIRRLVFASSETVYGPSQEHYGNHAVKEDEYCAPHDHAYLYGVMKILNERIAAEYVNAGRLDVACARPPVVFGDGRDRGAVMWAGQFASLPAVGKKARLPFSRSSRESWIYVDDCAEQFVRLTLKPGPLSHQVYNSGGASLSAGEMMEMVRQWLPDTEVEFDESVPRTPLVDDTNGTRLAKEIGFEPRPVLDALKLHINEARFRAGLKPIQP